MTSLVLRDFEPDFLDDVRREVLEYALTSKPFTYNRMKKPVRQCVENIAKGKFVERLFVATCRRHGIAVDVDRCTTPFWARDYRDFVFMGREWDVKSLFLHAIPPNDQFDDCLALVPNDTKSDQWATREVRYVPDLAEPPAYIFVFFGPLDFRINLTSVQESFLRKLCQIHGEKAASQQPFTKDWFVDSFPQYHDVDLKLSSSPVMAITGFASCNEWSQFRPFAPGPVSVGGRDVYRTRIVNMAAKAGELPSFPSFAGWGNSD